MLLSAGLVLVLTACGALSPAPAQPTTVRATAGNLTLTASPAALKGGETANVSLTVQGPADYQGGCVQTLQIWVIGPSGGQVWTEPAPALMCMAIVDKHLAAGENATFHAQWPVASGLAQGSYAIHGLFLFTLPRGAGTRVRENLPQLSVQIVG
jgi:hypothetical protein